MSCPYACTVCLWPPFHVRLWPLFGRAALEVRVLEKREAVRALLNRAYTRK